MRLPRPSGHLWRDRNFLTFWSAQAVSEFGDRISELALPLIAVTLLDASPAEVGLLTAAVWAPNLISLLIGTWVEQRADKRRLMIGADLARTIILLSLPVAGWFGWLGLPQLYLVALLAGTAHVLFNTAYAAFFVQLVVRDRYLEASAKLSGTRSISQMGGPALGGLLVQFLGAPVAVIADALSFIFSAAQVARIKLTPKPPEASTETLLQRARAGMAYLITHPYLRVTLACATTVNLFSFIGMTLVVFYASRDLGLSAGIIGLAFGLGATGGLLGATMAEPLSKRIGVGRLIAIGAVLFPASVAIVAFAGGPWLLRAVALAAAEFVGGFAVMCFDVPLGALQTSVIDDRMRSRVSGAFTTINYGIRPIGALIGGALGDWLGARETILISSVGGIVAFLWLLGSPVLKVTSIEALQSETD